jgi:hypothetical protein
MMGQKAEEDKKTVWNAIAEELERVEPGCIKEMVGGGNWDMDKELAA